MSTQQFGMEFEFVPGQNFQQRGDSSVRTNVGFFQEGVNEIFTGGQDRKAIRGRLLPAFDLTMSPADAAFKTGVKPYRDRSNCTTESGLPAFEKFYAALKGYRFFGRGKLAFLSPSTLYTLGLRSASDSLHDPVQDIRAWAKDNRHECYNRLFVKQKVEGSFMDRAICPPPKSLAAMNFFTDARGNGPEVSILVIPYMGLEKMMEDMDVYTVPNQVPLDPKWPEFLLGDVTAPETGLVGTVVQEKVSEMTCTFLKFSSSTKQLRDHFVQPVGPDVLAKRYNLFSGSVLKVPTYQQLVDILVDEGTIPHEVIKAACSHRATVKAASRKRPAGLEDDEEGDDDSGHAAPATQAYPTAAAAPAAFPPTYTPPPAASALPQVNVAAEPKFWFSAQNKTYPQAMTLSQAQAAASVLPVGTPVMMANENLSGGWFAGPTLGVSAPAIPAAPAPPAFVGTPTPPPAPPTPPQAPEPPPVAPPVSHAVPVAADSNPTPAPAAGSPWDPTQEARLTSLMQMMKENQFGTTDSRYIEMCDLIRLRPTSLPSIVTT